MNTNTSRIHNPEYWQCFPNNQNRMVYFQSTGLLESGSTCMRAVTSKLCSDPEGEFSQIKYQNVLMPPGGSFAYANKDGYAYCDRIALWTDLNHHRYKDPQDD
jgi:hypothetical protein